ncbi:MAG: hypothetical protein HUU15_04155 [Candidatus Brocadiae bacterium]|nr:hypothetical protein [Candidatus Brocadiia bacterium]
MRRATEPFLRVLLRRPDADAFAAARKGVETPGMTVLGPEGETVATTAVGGNAAGLRGFLDDHAR